jgi:hypothetical protein
MITRPDLQSSFFTNEKLASGGFDVSMKLTVREIRRILFETEKFTVIGEDERSNEESRYFLYIKENQGELFNVISKENHLLIWQ